MTTLRRRLGLGNAIVIGLASMIGAGVFCVWAPAADAAGSGLLVGLLVAAIVASLNALSSAQLAMAYPVSGGAYAFGRATVGPWTGFAAGWLFLAGKTASVGAIALIAGSYLWPEQGRVVAVVVVAVLAVVNMTGIRSTAAASATIVFSVIMQRRIAGIVNLVGRSRSRCHAGWNLHVVDVGRAAKTRALALQRARRIQVRVRDQRRIGGRVEGQNRGIQITVHGRGFTRANEDFNQPDLSIFVQEPEIIGGCLNGVIDQRIRPFLGDVWSQRWPAYQIGHRRLRLRHLRIPFFPVSLNLVAIEPLELHAVEMERNGATVDGLMWRLGSRGRASQEKALPRAPHLFPNPCR